MTAFSNLIEALGAHLGYEIEIDDNTCAVGFDDVSILLMGLVENGEDTLVMTTDLGTPPPQGLEKLYEEMMNAMFAHQATGGGSFARNPEGRFWLQRVQPLAGLTPEALVAQITRLGEAAVQWKKIIDDFRESDFSSGPEGEAEAVPGLGNAFMQV